jgi:hypothetical protein
MAAYTLTIRNGPRVEREKFAELGPAITELRRRAEEILGEGRLPDVSAFRDYGSEQRVKARLEVSTGRLLNRREAGIDVMGDNSVVAFSGGVFRNPIEGVGEHDFEAAIAEALRE